MYIIADDDSEDVKISSKGIFGRSWSGNSSSGSIFDGFPPFLTSNVRIFYAFLMREYFAIHR